MDIPSQLPQLDHYQLRTWDKGVFLTELSDLNLFPRRPRVSRFKKIFSRGKQPEPEPGAVHDGTVEGTKMALTEFINTSESLFSTYFAATGLEPIIPVSLSRDEKRKRYKWSTDNFPPHCAFVPSEDNQALVQIFDALALARLGPLLKRIIPNGNFLDQTFDKLRFEVLNKGPKDLVTISDIEAFNSEQRNQKGIRTDAYQNPNIGDRDDWYRDAVFAQQAFTGVSPSTIELCPAVLLEEFRLAAQEQKNPMASILNSSAPDSLYVNDYRYFRRAMGLPQGQQLFDEGEGVEGRRYGNAAVCLYHLSSSGALHPLAIVLDYKEGMANSVVIFNDRLRATDPTTNEANDWPWRYAKLCATVSDWVRHEVGVHLTHTHLIEEAIIVACRRSFDDGHPVLRILQPHWYKTLPLNAAARETLVPSVIVDLMGTSSKQAMDLVNWEYNNFDFVGSYVPADLERRGFAPATLGGKKFHNYGYAKNMYNLWGVIRKFVRQMLDAHGVYSTDADVVSDRQLGDWCNEMRDDKGGRLKSFPTNFTTIDQLVDALTMCIHIASPQHTAVNYLQQYYQSFIPNRPAALCAPLPSTLTQLKAYKENDVVAALPIHRPREWLLMSHVPWLLSFRVEEKYSLAGYAKSLYDVNKIKKDAVGTRTGQAAKEFYEGLRNFEKEMYEISDGLDDKEVGYIVLDPQENAVSILI